MTKFYLLLSRYLTVLLILVATVASAQNRTVSGKVTSADDGSGMPGVSIAEKGTSNGVTSDAEGNYTISVGQNAVLVFSFVGMVTQEVPVGSQTNLSITMVSDVTELSEVVVVGYGTVERKDVTGSVVSVTSKDFNRGVTVSPQDLLLGKVAGLTVTSSSGAPGASSTIRIRGGSSLNASNDPLIVIDGFPVDNGGISGSPNILSTINPNDIETFTVLKDASATAIYGSRASNGVIIITTKKGTQDKMQIFYNGTVSVSKGMKFLDVMTGDEVRETATRLEAEGFSGLSPAALNRLGDANTDWQKEVYQTAVSSDNNLGISGAIKNFPYRVSLGHTTQEGILKNTDMSRNSLDFKLNPSFLNNKLNVNVNLKTSRAKHNFGNGGAVGAAVAFDPTQPVKNGNDRWGGYYTWTELSQASPDGSNNPEGDRTTIGVANPVALIEQTDNQSTVDRTLGNIQVDYRLPFFPDMTVNVNAGFDRTKGDGYNYIDEDAGFLSAPQVRLTDYGQTNGSQLLDIYFNYRKTVGDQKFDVTGGYSWQHFEREGFNYVRNTDESIVSQDQQYKNENFLVSFFGRVNYSLKEKYNASVTLRTDGSSRFAEENRWGFFPAVGLGWTISQEAFLQDVTAISNLKLRLGYGITGQQDISGNYYPYLPTYTESQAGAYYQFGNEFYSTYRPNPYDANIKWEETTTYNAAIDFGLFNGTITGALEVYKRVTDDLISFVPIAAGSNFSNYLTTNVGSLENNGIELTLNAQIIRKTDFDWNVGFNLAHNKNEITNLTLVEIANYPGIPVGGISGGVGNTIQNHQVGHPANSFYVFQQVYGSNGKPLEGVYVDRTGNGGSVTSNLDNKYYYEKPAADILMGINTSVRYKKFDLYLSGRLSIGNYVYNNVFSDRALYTSLYNQAGFFNNLPTAVNDTKFSTTQYFSDYYIENASFFKMDNMSVGYNFNQLLSQKLKGRISFTVQNAFFVTNYSGLDPEVDGGIDNNIYPRPRVFLVGINLTY
jgi:TonB-dependent starch-binding outer membrane protein SusC